MDSPTGQTRDGSNDAHLRKDVPFWGGTPFRGSNRQKPNFWAVFKPNVPNIETFYYRSQILHSDLKMQNEHTVIGNSSMLFDGSEPGRLRAMVQPQDGSTPGRLNPIPVQPQAGLRPVTICRTLIGSHTHGWNDLVLGRNVQTSA